MIRTNMISFTLVSLLGIGELSASPVFLKCVNEDKSAMKRYEIVTAEANPSSGSQPFSVYKSYIHEDRARPEIWSVSSLGRSMVSRATDYEFINSYLIQGSRRDGDELRYETHRPHDTADHFISRLGIVYSGKPDSSIAQVFILNRATLQLKEVIIAGGGIVFEDGSFSCRIAEANDIRSLNQEVKAELEEVANIHNESVQRSVPVDSIGKENQF